MRIEVDNIAYLPNAAEKLLKVLGDRKIVALEGEMGAGKTTLVSAMCRLKNMDDEVSSPTFAIVNEYRSGQTGEKIFHFDFYRIESDEEVLDLGTDEYFSSGALCLMEWSEKIKRFLPEETVFVHIKERPDGSRLITLEE